MIIITTQNNFKITSTDGVKVTPVVTNKQTQQQTAACLLSQHRTPHTWCVCLIAPGEQQDKYINKAQRRQANKSVGGSRQQQQPWL